MLRLGSVALLTLVASCVALAGVGCGGGAGDDGGGPFEEIDNGFESDDPSGRNAQASAASGSSSGGSQDAGASAPSDGANEAARAVEEADIVKLEGDRLYALSKYGGLAIVDVTNPDQPKLLGRRRIDGEPFEMYVQAGRAFVMLNDFGRWVHDDTTAYGRWVQSSEILALDVANPAAITEASHFDVPGTIADSRVVGSAAYVVTYESGSCWGCQATPATIVTSFDLAGAITKSDQLIFSSPNQSAYSWQRSVSATNERLYVAGPEWGWTPGSANASSVIQVVDITDPSGKLRKGADVSVAGQIDSRWQMDEYGGVLRVVSQFGSGWGGANGQINPKVQTFTVNSATDIQPLGSTELILPKPEQLRSVRFDGTRGYAITAERTDPLFTIDLSDPAAPKQAGELSMPGWIFYMEPRGDRLVGFGYDDTAPSQANLAVSLFDVSNLASPTMLKRVSFGAGWSQLPEDQDRIHKAVRVLDDAGMILVPFASYGRWNQGGCEPGKSGIQILDYGHDDLALRGIAPQYGMPRRALVANGRLLAMSDRNVSTFDITSRDNPVKTGELDLSNPAYRLVELPEHVASVTSDWWSGEVMLSLTPKANADDASVVGKLSLASLATPNQAYCYGASGWASWYEARLFASGTTVYVTVPVYTYDANERGGKLVAAAIDVSNPSKPALLGKVETAFVERDMSYGYWGGYGYGFWDGWSYWSYYGGQQSSLVGSGQAIVQVGAKLAYIENDFEPVQTTKPDGTTWFSSKLHRRIHVIDFASPAQPTAQVVALADSLGSAPLHVWNGTVLTSRWVQSTKHPDKVRFFVDRLDLRGTAPALLPSINTPGSLLLADEASSRFVTTDYHATRIAMDPSSPSAWQDCLDQLGPRAWLDYEAKTCIEVDRDFRLSDVTGSKVKLRQVMPPPSQNIGGVQIADDRVYVTRFKQYDYSEVSYVGGVYEPKVVEDGGLWAIGGIRAGHLSVVSELVGDANWPLAAHGTKVALYTDGGLAIYDTATPTATKVTEANLRGWGYSSHVLMSDSRAIASLGEWGLQTIAY
jgi:hypothetical protein